ncbi:MAG: hypothetical protein HY829_14845 [Actinobacteria bacterium]|nr:hypothetical protein [Actinomycetota bacterium]
MADLVLHATSPLPALACFERLVDWEAHSAAIPFTTLRYEGVPRAGQRRAYGLGLRRLLG